MTYEDDCYEYCYECQAYGDDYYEDDNGELICACNECPWNELNYDDE